MGARNCMQLARKPYSMHGKMLCYIHCIVKKTGIEFLND